MESNGPIRDYLKYWRVVRLYVKAKYEISEQDLDMLFFLYSEGRFNKKIFKGYEKIFPWTTRRFNRLVREGWIIEDTTYSKNRQNKIYSLTLRSKKMVGSIYKYLDGSDTIPVGEASNPLFNKRASSQQKRVANEVLRINRELKGLTR